MPTRRSTLTALAGLPLLASSRPSRAANPDHKPLRYIQIGTAHAHANKISVYRESPDWEVVGVVEPDPGRARRAQDDATYRDLPFYSLDDALALPDLDAAGVETEVKDLLTYAGRAVDAGLHVHLDKPAGESLEDYASILARAEQAGKVVQMGYMFRFNPAIIFLHQCLKQGWLGDVFEAHAVMSKVVSPAERKSLGQYPGGIMFELGCHIIDLTVGVLGAPSSVSPFNQQIVAAEDDLVDNMLSVFTYPSATATVRSSALEVEGFARRQFTVCGTAGTLHVQPLDRPSVTLSLDQDRTSPEGRTFKKGTQTLEFGAYPRYVGDAADLAAIIRGEAENRFPPAHDLAVQKAVLLASSLID